MNRSVGVYLGESPGSPIESTAFRDYYLLHDREILFFSLDTLLCVECHGQSIPKKEL